MRTAENEVGLADGEIMKVWMVGGNQHFLVRAGTWKDPAAWGLLFADLTRFIARTSARSDAEAGTVVARIMAGYEAELK